MQQLKTTVLMMCTAMLFAACEKAPLYDGGNDSITGSWNWESTDGGIAFNIHETPQTTGTKKEVQFTADGKYRWYTNGTQTALGNYTLVQQKCIHDEKQKWWIQFSEDPQQNRLIEVLTHDVLLLSDEAHDGVMDKFTRTARLGH